jgi:hypothetical protein
MEMGSYRLRGIRLRFWGSINENGKPSIQQVSWKLKDDASPGIPNRNTLQNGNGHKKEDAFSQEVVYQSSTANKDVTNG